MRQVVSMILGIGLFVVLVVMIVLTETSGCGLGKPVADVCRQAAQ